MKPWMNISEAARATGLSAQMIRRYEELGLLPEVPRTQSGYRLYGREDLATLNRVRLVRHLGFSVEQTARLAGLPGDAEVDPAALVELVAQHLADVRGRLQALTAIRRRLEALLAVARAADRPRSALLEMLARDDGPAAEPHHAGATSPACRLDRTARFVTRGHAGVRAAMPN